MSLFQKFVEQTALYAITCALQIIHVNNRGCSHSWKIRLSHASCKSTSFNEGRCHEELAVTVSHKANIVPKTKYRRTLQLYFLKYWLVRHINGNLFAIDGFMVSWIITMQWYWASTDATFVERRHHRMQSRTQILFQMPNYLTLSIFSRPWNVEIFLNLP